MIRTWSMMTAAALMASGFPLVSSERVSEKRIVFCIDARAAPSEADRIMHSCQQERCFGVRIDLGKYEQARQELMDLIHPERGTGNDTRRRT